LLQFLTAVKRQQELQLEKEAMAATVELLQQEVANNAKYETKGSSPHQTLFSNSDQRRTKECQNK